MMIITSRHITKSSLSAEKVSILGIMRHATGEVEILGGVDEVVR